MTSVLFVKDQLDMKAFTMHLLNASIVLMLCTMTSIAVYSTDFKRLKKI